MSEPDDVPVVIVVPRTDPVYSVYVWRQDSVTLARLRPILNQLRYVTDQPCRLHIPPHTCINSDPDEQWCISCQIRAIKVQLFGDPNTDNQE